MRRSHHASHRHGSHHRELSRIDAAFCALVAVGCCAAGVAGDALAGLRSHRMLTRLLLPIVLGVLLALLVQWLVFAWLLG
jgi:hypothetical protein